MAQAKTLTETELRRVLDYVATRKHAVRNRALVLVTHLAGMRVGEVASLRYEDVVDCDKKIRNEIRLDAEQTKGRHSRTVFVSERLRKELAQYVKHHPCIDPTHKLFYTQKRRREGFTANTLTQHFLSLYKNVGIEGASSHSGRRTYATTMASKGVGVRVLMRALGHRNISTTMQYVDASDDMIRRAVELI
jgi:integrase/recombinase XerD